ncbi:MarR family winged helix-turn-helix transcriptional regulator [Streptomyces sp. NPDC056161]|uniref:MarR family winged helix-turn-helix transcriptional regulator n=1 Tax=Streptomyces sp. NPDC056161 TaxID=3345732 RepID=UPI0035D53AF2
MKRRAGERDLTDGLVDSWRREKPELERPEYAVARRAVRLGVLLEETLNAALVPWNLTKTDFAVISALRLVGAPYELRPSDLKNRLLITSGGVTTVLKRLERADLIEREQDTVDGRSSWVRLTRTGVETADATMETWSEAESRFFREVPPEVTRAASEALREVMIAVGDLEPPLAQAGKRRARSAPEALTSP